MVWFGHPFFPKSGKDKEIIAQYMININQDDISKTTLI